MLVYMASMYPFFTYITLYTTISKIQKKRTNAAFAETLIIEFPFFQTCSRQSGLLSSSELLLNTTYYQQYTIHYL